MPVSRGIDARIVPVEPAPRRRSPPVLAALHALLLAALVVAAPPARTEESDAPRRPDDPLASNGAVADGGSREAAFDPAELEGADEKVGQLAAHRLLQAIGEKDARDEAARATNLKYLLEKLSPTRLSRAGAGSSPDTIAAERIVDALATWTTSSGPPFAQSAEVLLPLLGEGSQRLRDAVVRAHRALILQELRGARRRPPGAAEPPAGAPAEPASHTIALIVAELLDATAPSDAFIDDAARVLWETDGKALLGALAGMIALHSKASPGTPAYAALESALDSLRARIPLDFPGTDGWIKWWEEAKVLLLEKILGDCQRKSRDALVASWRQLLKRLRETGDAERTLFAIQDALDGLHTPELRVSAVAALADFPDWLDDLRLAEPATPEKKPDSDPKDRLLSKAVGMLTSLYERKVSRVERPDVLRQALSALGKYHAFLERSPAQLAQVSRIVVDRMQDLSRDGGAQGPDFLDAIRLAGALRVQEALGFVASILREPAPGAQDDLELLTAAASALGRLSERGFDQATAALLMGHFQKTRTGPEKAVRELRRACLTALSAGSERPEVRADLRRFYRDALLGGEKDFRIPAILGLGTLARQKDTPSYDVLVDVLTKQDQFAPQEVIAAIDSIAYVGGRQALEGFFRCILPAKDKAVEEHLWKKVVSLIEAGGTPALAWALEGLERLAVEADASSPLELAVRLTGEGSLKGLLASEKVDIADGGRTEQLWSATLALARAKDALGDEEGASAQIVRLGDLLQKTPELKEKLSQESLASLQTIKTTLAQRSALKGKLAKAEMLDAQATFQDFQTLLASDPTAAGRWRCFRWAARVIPGALPQERAEKAADLWRKFLSGEEARELWTGLPAGFKERYLSRLGAGPAGGAEKKAEK